MVVFHSYVSHYQRILWLVMALMDGPAPPSYPRAGKASGLRLSQFKVYLWCHQTWLEKTIGKWWSNDGFMEFNGFNMV